MRIPAVSHLFCLVVLFACSPKPPDSPPPAQPLPPVDQPLLYVDPFIGSGGFGYRDGSSFVGATAPQGLAKVGPDTSGPFGLQAFLHFTGYWYGDNMIQGFSHMHLHGTGSPDYGVLTVMPLDGFDAARTGPDGYQSPFRKNSETVSPGYYGVTLDRGAIKAEFTATPHAAHHRYTFPKSAPERVVLFDLSHHLDGGMITDAQLTLIPAEGRLRGSFHSTGGLSHGFGGFDVYFEARARRPWARQRVWSSDAAPADGTQAAGTGVGCALMFDDTFDPIEMQVGLSLVSVDHAAANLMAELPQWDFEDTKQKTQAAWTQLLKAVRIEGGTEVQRRIFYTGLYHAFLMPSIHGDVDGSYRAPDGKVYQAQDFHYVSDLSLWDTYRTLHPLYAIIAPQQALDAVRSLHQMALASGHFPKWALAGGDSGSLVGASSEIVVADAYVKGITGFDALGAYGILRTAALDPVAPAGGRGGRDDVESYIRLGYVPATTGASVSVTTEYARDDFALGNLAMALGKTEDGKALSARAQSYRKLFDPGAGFLRGRNADGTFSSTPFDPLCFCTDYDEANAWQSLWMTSFDADGLAQLLGGRAALAAKLGEFFDKGAQDVTMNDPSAYAFGAEQRPYYWAGNEPDIHAAYLFAQVGRPDLTQRWVRWIMAHHYGDKADGLPGNDDGGTLSAWYILSAMGLYPLPGSDRYTLGTPLFPRMQVRVGSGTFTIVADGVSEENLYVLSADLDGKPLATPEIRHGDLRAGSTLHFVMGKDPGSFWQVP